MLVDEARDSSGPICKQSLVARYSDHGTYHELSRSTLKYLRLLERLADLVADSIVMMVPESLYALNFVGSLSSRIGLPPLPPLIIA